MGPVSERMNRRRDIRYWLVPSEMMHKVTCYTTEEDARSHVRVTDWHCIPAGPMELICEPLLTMEVAAVIERKLPCKTRRAVVIEHAYMASWAKITFAEVRANKTPERIEILKALRLKEAIANLIEFALPKARGEEPFCSDAHGRPMRYRTVEFLRWV